MGTQIINHGIEPGKIPDLLNIENPELITEIHHSYYQAGSDMCQTNTFGSNYMNLKKHDIEDKIVPINEAALENIKKAQISESLIVGDIGPSGEFKPPVGKASYEDWCESYLKQAKILYKEIDVWHIETISDIDEMLAAIEAIKEVSNKPIISSMTYRKTKKGFFTLMGDSIESCISKVKDKVSVIGTNCTLGSKDMIDLFKEINKSTDKPISVKPNAGKPRLDKITSKTVYEQPIEEYVKDIEKLVKLGAKIVGGCCGTSPSVIHKIKEITTP
jgi:5-methyltetrahydrofolate--homocysteine methyltransferase